MKIKYIIIILYFFTILTGKNLFGEKKLFLQNINYKKEYLHSKIKSVIQDKNGFIWIADNFGIYKFDGYKSINFHNVQNDSKSLSNNIINSMIIDRNGKFWICTENGLNLFDPKTEIFKRYLHKENNLNTISHNNINTIYEDKKGILWIGTFGGGLNKYNPETDKFTHYINKNDSSSISSNIVNCLLEDSSGRLWIGTDNKLNYFDKEKRVFKHIQNNAFKKSYSVSNRINVIFEYNVNEILIGTNNGAFIYNTELDSLSRFNIITVYNELLDDLYINTFYRDKDKILWLGTRGGLLSSNNDKFNFYKNENNSPNNLRSNKIHSIFEDKIGSLWIGTYGAGIYKFDRELNHFSNTVKNNNNKQELSNKFVLSIVKEEDKDIIWVGTYSGLNRYNRNTNSFKHFFYDKSNPNSISNNTIRSLYFDMGKTLWIGTDNGLNSLDIKTNKFTLFFNDKINLDNNYIGPIFEDREGKLWIGTNGGINVFDKAKNILKKYKHDSLNPNSLGSDIVLTFHEQISKKNKSVMWIGTYNGGLNRLSKGGFLRFKKKSSGINSISSNNVRVIYEDKEGVFWIGTDNGMDKFNPINHKFKNFSYKNELNNKFVYSIIEDENNTLWLSTNNGIINFNKKDYSIIKTFSIDDGLEIKSFMQDAYYQSKDGEIFFGGINGFLSFFPFQVKKNKYIPPVVITELKVLDRKTNKSKIFNKLLNGNNEITLSYSKYILSFKFVALDYTDPEKNQYAYKLKGVTDKWIYLNNKRDITFIDLAPGHYTFRVKGSNNDGIWNEKGVSVRFYITPPFWLTWWFLTISFIVFMILSYLFINFIKGFLDLKKFWKKKTFIDDYRLIDNIGSGGMANIYKAVDYKVKDQKPVAIKLMKDDIMEREVQRKRFINEGLIIDNIKHENIVQIIKRGEFNKKLYIVMELLDGISLADKIENDIINIRETVEILIQITDALSLIHSLGIIHRDLKPENIMMIHPDSNRLQFVNKRLNSVKLEQNMIPVILDFGLAKINNTTRLTDSGLIVGTVNYLPPENLNGSDLSFASDIYSLGIIFYYMLTKALPYSGESTLAIMTKILNKSAKEPKLINPNIPENINNLIMKMISYKSEDRPKVKQLLIELIEISNNVL